MEPAVAENRDDENTSQRSSRKRSRDHLSSSNDTCSKTFTVDRWHSKKFCRSMSTVLKPSDARSIRKSYDPVFKKRSVSLLIPKVDHSMARRMKEKKGRELTKVEQIKISDFHAIQDFGHRFSFLSLCQTPMLTQTSWMPVVIRFVWWVTLSLASRKNVAKTS